MHLKITTRTTTTAILAVTLVIGTAAVLVFSLVEQAQAQTPTEEAAQRLHTLADQIEQHDPSAAAKLHDTATRIGGFNGGDGGVGGGCSPWDPRC
jgi:hypothetical protein